MDIEDQIGANPSQEIPGLELKKNWRPSLIRPSSAIPIFSNRVRKGQVW